jgi:hypothetical protein
MAMLDEPTDATPRELAPGQRVRIELRDGEILWGRYRRDRDQRLELTEVRRGGVGGGTATIDREQIASLVVL